MRSGWGDAREFKSNNRCMFEVSQGCSEVQLDRISGLLCAGRPTSTGCGHWRPHLGRIQQKLAQSDSQPRSASDQLWTDASRTCPDVGQHWPRWSDFGQLGGAKLGQYSFNVGNVSSSFASSADVGPSKTQPYNTSRLATMNTLVLRLVCSGFRSREASSAISGLGSAKREAGLTKVAARLTEPRPG